MVKKQKKAAMRPPHPGHPGMERDAHGNAIPIEKRLPEDRAKAHRAAKKSRGRKKKSS